MVTLFVLRHADAERIHPLGDRTRELSPKGLVQADALVDAFVGIPLDRILASPARRCRNTVAAIGEAHGLHIEVTEQLAEGTPFDVVTRLLAEADGPGTLLCTHGDVIGSLLDDVRERVGGSPRWPTASVWVLDRWPAPSRVVLSTIATDG